MLLLLVVPRLPSSLTFASSLEAETRFHARNSFRILKPSGTCSPSAKRKAVMAENDSVRALNEGKETPEEEEDEGEEKEENPPSELQSSARSVTVPNLSSSFDEDLRNQSSQSEALGIARSVSSSENDHEPDCGSFSRLLASTMESPVANSTAILPDGLDVKRTIHTPSVDPRTFPEDSPSSLLDATEFKLQFEMSQQGILASVTAQDAQTMSSAPGSTSIQQKLTPVPHHIDTCMTEIYQQNSLDQKTKSAHVIVKTPSADGYNWRKYGQKQVKSSESSRSYYKCTYSDCYAKKKIEQCDHSGRVIEIIYKGQHTHDPPLKIRCTRARRLVSSSRPISSKNTTDSIVRKLNDSDLSPPRSEPKNAMLQTSECKEQSPSCSDRSTDIKAERIDDEPEPKRRMKESNVEYSVPLFKIVKEPKVVVQATGDVGISGDGYRWRKYGQKMVKGNPCPRSYYKCTSAGCPVRKHVERATDDTAAIIITYEGKHDHDMPVPKKRHGQPSAALLIAAAAAMNNAQFKKAEALPKQRSSTQCPRNMESEFAGETAFDLGGEKALESARTLLSIGIELKPC